MGFININGSRQNGSLTDANCEVPPKPTGHAGAGGWSWGPADQSPTRPSLTCAAIPAGSSSGAAPGTRPDPTPAPAPAPGAARPLRSLCSSASRRPVWLGRLLSTPLLRAVAVAVAGLDLALPESSLRPESHITKAGALPEAPASAPAQSPRRFAHAWF